MKTCNALLMTAVKGNEKKVVKINKSRQQRNKSELIKRTQQFKRGLKIHYQAKLRTKEKSGLVMTVKVSS